MYFFLASYPILGAGLKYIDDAFYEKIFDKKIAYCIAPLLGALWAYAMIISAVSATILLAIVVGVLLKGKIDNFAHVLGLVVIFGVIIVFGIELLYLPLFLLTLSALFDEVGNDYVDKKGYLQSKVLWHKTLGYFFDQRWLTKVALLGLVALGHFPLYFLVAMILFDGAYISMRWYSLRRQTTQKIKRQVSLT